MEGTAAPIVEEFNQWLARLLEGEGSDLHVKVHSAPMVRMPDGLERLPREPLTNEEVDAIAAAIIPADRTEKFAANGEVDFAYSVPNVGRFRVNVFRQRGSISMVLRKLRFGGPSFEEIGLPESVRSIADEQRGLILVTGPTGSGKTTTLAAMIDYINKTKPVHIVTIEDPIEVLHKDEMASINQREIGSDTGDFLVALRAALRQDPDVILIGEMRDEETVQTALSAAETGHLVLSTIHTVDATESINRMLDFFPPHQHAQARSMIAGTIKGVISQRLVPGAEGGRVAVCEILRMTGRVRDMIIDPSQTGKLVEVIASGGYYGMQTFDQALFDHVKAGRVTFEDAMHVASSPHDFKLLMQAEGRVGTTMEDVATAEQQRAPDEAPPPTGSAGGPASLTAA
jgi:twitching motility protein PilT